MGAPYGSALLLGGTGTGKTYGLKSILRQLLDSKKTTLLYTINVKDSEYAEDFKKRHIAIQFERINTIRPGSVVVIEDIIDLKTAEEVSLRQLLNWHAHHKKLKIFAVSHNIFKTKLYNTVTYFNFVVFTSALGNLFVVKRCLQYFQLEDETVDSWTQKIRVFGGKRGIYFYFDVQKRCLWATNNLALAANGKLLGLETEGEVGGGGEDKKKRPAEAKTAAKIRAIF